jgi:protein-tyrosine phosphatase
VRYLVLLELCEVIEDWTDLLDADLITRVQQMTKKARNRSRLQLLDELSSDEQKTDEVLDWFEQSLAGMNNEVVA